MAKLEKSGTTGQESDSTASGTDPNAHVEDAKTMEVVPPSGPQQRTAKEGDTDEGDVERSVSLVRVVVLDMQCE